MRSQFPCLCFLIRIRTIMALHRSSKSQGGAWYAEALDRAVIRKLKHVQGFRKFSGWRSRGNLPWVTQGMSCKRFIKANL